MSRPRWRGPLAAACARRAALGLASLVLYDVSTLYFETDAGDGFRESGFSNYADVSVVPRSSSLGDVFVLLSGGRHEQQPLAHRA